MKLRQISRAWGLLLAGVLAGTVLLGPASAHFPGDLGHGKKHFLTKKAANKKFLKKKEQAADAKALEGQSAASLAGRVASTFSNSASGSTLATTTIAVPAPGYLVLDGIADLFNNSGSSDFGSCSLTLDGSGIADSEYGWSIGLTGQRDGFCRSHTVVPITPGNHTVTLIESGAGASTTVDDGRVTALYVPFGATGARP